MTHQQAAARKVQDARKTPDRPDPSLLNWLTYFPVESPARLETSLSALRRQKHPLRALRRGRREGGPLSPPTLARRAAWRVISIQETRCHWMMRSGFSPSDEDEGGGARECHG